ncbi:MAG: hypothetical protein C4335_07825 [Armatimonadota bacterium]
MLRLRALVIIPFILLSPLAADEDVLDAKADARLQKEVSVFQPPAPLSAVVKALSQQTGVALQAERNISQYRAILVAEEKPLHEVLRKLADAFGFTWERRGKEGGPPSYLLVQTPADSAREAAELREIERLADEMFRYTASLAGRWSPEVKNAARARMEERIKTSDARLKEGRGSRAEVISILREVYAFHSVERAWSRSAILALASLTPTQVRQVREGAVLLVKGDALPAEALRLILDEWRETEALVPNPTEPGGLRVDKPYQSKPWDNVEVWLFPDTSAGNVQSLVYFTGPDLREGGRQIHPVTVSPWDLYLQINGIMHGMIEPRLPDSPLFQKPTQPAEFDRKSNAYLVDPMGVELAYLARANRVCLAAEWYPFSLGGSPRESVQPLASWAQAQRHLRDYAAEIGASEGWVMVRSFARISARRTNISHEQIIQWLLKPRAEGWLSLGDYAQIAFLHERQRETLRSAVRRLQARGATTGSASPLSLEPLLTMARSPRMVFALQGYALLPAVQKRALLNGQPIPLSAMPRQSALRFQISASLPPPSYEAGESLPPEVSSGMALVLRSRAEAFEHIEWSQVPEEMREPSALRPWLGSLSPEERAKVMRTVAYWDVTLSLTDGEREVPLASLSVLQ